MDKLKFAEFGDAPRQDVCVVDIDQSARLNEAQKREGVTFVKAQKHGQKCRGWSGTICAGEVIDQKRQSWLSSLHR